MVTSMTAPHVSERTVVVDRPGLTVGGYVDDDED